MSEVSIRLALESDLAAIDEIYNYYVLNSTCTFQLEPETAEDRQRWFAAHNTENPVTVAECEGVVVGWGALSQFRDRSGYRFSVEPSVYVRHDHLSRGLGRLLLVDLIERARQLGRHTVIGGTCSEHAASRRLQESLGFQRVAYLKDVGFKFGRWLDVEYMQFML